MTEYLAFPFSVRSGRVATVDSATHVRQIIEVALFTEPGERVNRPNYGAGADQLVFEPDNGALAAAAKHLVQGALQQSAAGLFQLLGLEVTNDGPILSITVTYVDKTSDTPKVVALERSQ